MFDTHTLFITKIPSYHMWVVFGIIIFAVVFYAKEKISMEITSLLVLAFLMIFFTLFPIPDPINNQHMDAHKILWGFASPALVAVLCLLIVGQAVIQNNALTIISSLILKISHNNAVIAVLLSLFTVLLISAFMNNTPVVVIFIPILYEVAKKLTISPSKIMIPLSYCSILGGMTTLLGSSTNLLVSGSIVSLGLKPIALFDFFVPGSILALVGFLYVSYILPKLLPDRSSSIKDYEDNRKFSSQINISQISGLIGKKLKEGSFPDFPNLTVKIIQRGNKIFYPPFQDEMELQEKDLVVVSGSKKALIELVSRKSEIFNKNSHIDIDEEHDVMDVASDTKSNDTSIAEVVITPASRIIGQNIKQIGFYNNYRCPIIGIQQQSPHVKSKISDNRLAAGDVLIIMGSMTELLELRNSKDVMLTQWSTEEIHSVSKVIKTIVIFLGVIICSAFNIMPISIASFVGATLLITLDCINIRQAIRAIDKRIALMIVASLAMGTAMQETGGASYIANIIASIAKGHSIEMILVLLFVLVTLMTNIISNNATAVLFAPIVVNMAIKLSIDPKVMIFALIFASNCSFITPIGYQTNLLVMSPGRYRFSDFVKGGIPLAFIMCITYILVAHWYFDL